MKKTQEISRINNSARKRLLIKLLSNVSRQFNVNVNDDDDDDDK
jgi:hypothetical protein